MRYYGGEPWTWLAVTPLALVRAHVAMLPRLRAEESMRLAEATAVGAGTLTREASRDIVRQWEREASDDPSPVGRIGGPLFPRWSGKTEG